MQTNSNTNNNKPNDNANKNPQAGSTIKDAPPQTETALDTPKDGQVQATGQKAGNDSNVDKQSTVGQTHDKSDKSDKSANAGNNGNNANAGGNGNNTNAGNNGDKSNQSGKPGSNDGNNVRK